MPRLTSNAAQGSLPIESLLSPQRPISFSTASVRMPLMVRQEDGSAAGPWMTLVIDNVSRMPVAVHVHLEEPSNKVLRQCLEKAVRRTAWPSLHSWSEQNGKRRCKSTTPLTPAPPKVPRSTS